MKKRKKSKTTFIASIVVLLLSSLIAIGQVKSSSPNNLITATSVGDIKLGMTIGEARKALPTGYTLGPGGGSEGVSFVGVFDGKKHLMDIGHYEDSRGAEKLPPINDDQKIGGITILDSRFKTADGVHTGMSIADAEKKYGKLKEMFNFPHEGEFGKFNDQPEFLRFNFRAKGDATEAGIYEEVPNCADDAYPPSCRKAVKYNPNSYISMLSVILAQPLQKSVSITDAPNDYRVNIYGPAECVEDVGETTYRVSWKVPMETGGGFSLPHQSFDFPGLLPCPEKGYGTDDTSISYKDQWDVYLGDYNFDGLTDLALRDGMNGGYGFPSYQVYLFSNADNKFVLSPSFTELGQYQGMFEVKANRKMIYNHTKSGCCSHTSEGYTIVNNKPFKVYDHTVEGMIEMANGVTTPEVITKKLINGKWRTWDKSSAMGISFDKGKTSKTISVKLTKNEPIKWFKVSASKGQILNATINSPDADVSLVDFKGNLSLYDSMEPVKEGEDFPVKLKGIGEYYLELSSEKDLTVELTISIK